MSNINFTRKLKVSRKCIFPSAKWAAMAIREIVCAFSSGRKNCAIRKSNILDSQANLPESEKGYIQIYIQKEWLDEYEYGKGMFLYTLVIVNTVMVAMFQ